MNHNIQSVKLYRMSMPEHECPWGLKAVALLNEKGIDFEDIKLTSREAVDAFKAQYNVPTTPQIFFGDERIGGYSDLAERLNVTAEKAEYSYTPVIAVFGVAALISIALSLDWMAFMGMALSILALLKLMDLASFVTGFEKYDLLTQVFKPYAWAYPFIELLLGLSFLSHIALSASGIVSLLIGLIGAISVFKAIYIDKLELNCACIGGNSKAPLGIISLSEYGMMILMGAMLIA